MQPEEWHSGQPGLAGAQETASRPRYALLPAGQADPVRPRAGRRWWPIAAWIGAGIVLFAFFLRISLSFAMDSDGANNALQGWDLLHGHLLLHGWILGDATYYSFELPLYAITEAVIGLSTLAGHVVSALTYLIVAACAVVLATADSKGLSRALRGAAVIAVLGSPLLTLRGVSILLSAPDHTGTSAIMMGSFLLIDRAPGRRFTPPLLCAILTVGQIGDETIRYVAVPAILLVCAYRIAAARKIRTPDTAILLAAAVSVVLALLIRAAMVRLGGYAMVPPSTAIAPAARWPHHVMLALRSIYTLFGAVVVPHAVLGLAGSAFGLICLLAALVGFGKVIWTWRTASRSQQLLCVAILVVSAAYVISMMPNPGNPYELVAVLPFGAVLAARACVPARVTGASRGRMAVGAGRAAAADRGGHRAHHAHGRRAPGRLAAGARPDLRHRRVLGCLVCHRAVRRPGPGPRGCAATRQDRPLWLGGADVLV